MSDQDALNQTATQIEADVAAENAAIEAIKTEIATLEANQNTGQPLDFTALKQAVADLDTSTGQLGQVAAPPSSPASPAS
jgi:hypothetical protein